MGTTPRTGTMGQGGIDKLLKAEQEAQKEVEKARKERTQKLKSAHEAASAEIKKYKQEKEQEFKIIKDKVLSGTGTHAADLAKTTEKEISMEKSQLAAKEKEVV